jgi:uncharacterized membrane protein
MGLFFLWLHVVAAAVWIGGMVFIAAVLIPVVRSPEFRSRSAELVRVTGRRFRTIGWGALVVLLVSGFYRAAERGVGVTALLSGEAWGSRMGRLLTVKLVLVVAVLVVSLLHDFSIGPRAGRAMNAEPGSERALALRRAASWMGRFNLVAALVIVALGLMLTRSCALP